MTQLCISGFLSMRRDRRNTKVRRMTAKSRKACHEAPEGCRVCPFLPVVMAVTALKLALHTYRMTTAFQATLRDAGTEEQEAHSFVRTLSCDDMPSHYT